MDFAQQQHEDFWIERLAHLQPVVLPYVFPQLDSAMRAAASEPATGRLDVPFTPALQASLETHFPGQDRRDLLLSAFVAYLARLSDRACFDVGLNVPRTHTATSHPGLSATYVPLRIAVDMAQPCTSLHRTIREQVALHRQHGSYRRNIGERYPELQAIPRLSINIAQVNSLDEYEHAPGNILTLVLAAEGIYWDFTPQVPDESYTGRVLRRSDDPQVLDHACATQMLQRFVTFTQLMLANPHMRLCDIPLLSPEERRQILVDWNATRTDYPRERCIHHLIEEQVARTPDAIAVIAADRQMSYRELNQRANHLAQQLQALGVGPETLVGLCVERSPAMAVGLLGILKAGGAYVPLDPHYPPERLAMILADARISVLVTQPDLQQTLPAHTAHTICLDTSAALPETITNPTSGVRPDNLAYVIYTSGSTGTPNGVMVPHAALVSHAPAFARKCALHPDDRMLQFASISFDVANEEILPCWLCGATLVINPGHVLATFADFMAFLEQQAVTVLNLPASFWHAWVDDLTRTAARLPASLRLVITGSEKVHTGHYLRWRAIAGERIGWLNAYGPTETTITALIFPPDDQGLDPAQLRSVPIGRPIDNVQVYLLDRQRQPVPVGVPGELYIGGAGVARGYLNRPELTAARFLPDPFNPEPNARLYKTGDLVRYLPNGTIEFLGRIDHQIKLRGFRIEPGEIEALLLQHPAVRAALVCAREADHGAQQLVAYLLTHPEQQLTPAMVRTFLRERLPEHMVPTAFVLLDAFPLTPSGKIDRRALPAPTQADLSADRPYAAPRTSTEELLAILWTEVLHLEHAGINDNFFELGGHSLLAIQVIAHLRAQLQIELPLRTFFETATLAELAQQIDLQRAADAPASPDRLPIMPVSRAGNLPASFAQERLWFIQQFAPDCLAYNSPAAIRFRGQLNTSVLEQSLNAVINRHETLRTTFIAVDGRPVLVITPELYLPLPVIDLRHLPPDMHETEAQRLLAADQQPFDLERGPLIRATLIRMEAADYILLVNMHHSITDGWSYAVFYRDLAAFYNAHLTGTPATLPDLPIQYADFAQWQRRRLQGALLEEHLAYWKAQLTGCPTLLPLPTDHPRPPVQSLRGGLYRQPLPAALVARLKEVSQAEGCTLFMAMTAAFATLLARYTGQTDIVIGSPVVERGRSEIEHLIGFFVNNLVLRIDLAGSPGFRELLRRTREVALGAYAHQDVPFEQVIDLLRLERDLSYQPLFQVALAMELEPFRGLDLPGAHGEHLEVVTGGAWFDLSLVLEERTEGLVGAWEYATDLFEEPTIRRMAGHFEQLLQQLCANPEQPVGTLPLLTPAERQQILVDWNATSADYPRDACIHQLIEAQVARTPDAIAVIADDRHLSYRELNRQANHLAHQLQALGVGPDVLVGLCVERSSTMAIGLLGILKAGGAYLPLDPAYPHERLALMSADAGVTLLVTQPHLRTHLPSLTAEVIYLDPDASVPGEWDNPVSAVQPDHLAYVIYTSGSTGTPNGVMVPHRALVNHNTSIARRCEIQAGDRILQFASLSFDASAEEIFPGWLCGATLVLRTDAALASFNSFDQFIAQHGITILDLPTAYWHAWVRHLEQTWATLPNTLRLVIVGGEAALPERYAAWQVPAGARIRWINSYGPTEATIVATIFAPDPAQAEQFSDSMPIGRPLDNVQVYILDQARNPVPIGVPGELHIGGAGLSRGYLNRPDLTSTRFIDLEMRDWGVATGGTGIAPDRPIRLYRTGDLARYRGDGTIEFLGRIDQQVKIRGFRIEPGEIETLLGQHPAVAVAVVVAREEMPGEWRLVAYVVPTDPEPRSLIPALRSFLQERLPDYMLPSAFIQLAALPLTPSGKLDRDALPLFDSTTRQDQTGYTAPRNPVEATLADIWADVLRRERVSTQDNFFALGGHSLQIMHLITQIEAALPYPVAIKDIFLYPTIAGLAEVLAQRSPLPVAPAVAPPQPEIDRTDRQETVPQASSAGSALTLELRPLLNLFAARKFAPVAAATFGTLPLPGLSPALLEQFGVSRNTVIDAWYDNLPVFDELLAMHLGRIALFTLPHFDDQLYQDQTGLIASIIEGLEMARWLGARVVSLAGLIPSATDYGRAIAAALAGRDDLPLLSTGHATTTAAVTLALDRILVESGRDITQERVAFLGLGSVGLAALRLMLRCRPHPETLLLCDIYQKQAELELLQWELTTESGFKGTIQIIASPGAVPSELYTATTIIGATNVPNILDITRVNSGTLIVDDSAPHCFDPDQARRRFEAEQDILFTEGGVVQSPQPITATRYLPRLAERALPAHAKALFAHYNPHEITGCILSSLLSARFAHLPPTLGYVDLATTFEHYTTLRRLGFRGAELHCEGYTLPASGITRFRRQFGT